MAITIPPSVAAGFSTAGQVVAAAAPIAAIATGIGFLVQGFKPKVTNYQKAKSIAEDITAFSGAATALFSIIDGVTDRMYPERKVAAQKNDPAVKMAEILDRMDARQAKLELELAATRAKADSGEVDARVKAAVAEALESYEAARAAKEAAAAAVAPPVVEQKPTTGKHLGGKVKKTGT